MYETCLVNVPHYFQDLTQLRQLQESIAYTLLQALGLELSLNTVIHIPKGRNGVS